MTHILPNATVALFGVSISNGHGGQHGGAIYTLSDGHGGTPSGTVPVTVGMQHLYLLIALQ